MKDDEITLNGFLVLNLMEAQDAEGDPNDLWAFFSRRSKPGLQKAAEIKPVSHFASHQSPFPEKKPDNQVIGKKKHFIT